MTQPTNVRLITEDRYTADMAGKADDVHTHVKGDVGLGNVDNTSDAAKPISTATQTALNGKADDAHTHTKADVGLGNVDNTSDAAKPVSTATQTALDGKVTAGRAGAISWYGTIAEYNALPAGTRNAAGFIAVITP